MALFGRRKRVAAPETADLGTVIVPRKSTEGETWQLVQAVVEYVNAQMEGGLYRHDELPQKALQAYHADYYLAQVNNGGHSQFIHNSRQYANVTWSNARAGLEAMGASVQAGLIAEMMAWAAQHADEMNAQTGFEGGRAEVLDRLDDRFFEVQKTAPMTDAAAAWIRGWPELRIVEDDVYPTVLRENALMNPKRADRLVARGIMRAHHHLSDRLHVSLAMAASGGENVEVLLGVGGGSHMQLDGDDPLVWTIQTTSGKRFVTADEDHARMYECIENSPPPKINHDDLDASFEAFQASDYQPPQIGVRLSDVSVADISEVMARAGASHAAAAVDLLLRKAELDPDDVRVTPLPPQPIDDGRPVLILLVTCGSSIYRVVVFPEGSMLNLVGENEPMSRAPQAEIDAHWARAEA